MRRREFIGLVGGLAAWPVASSAQRRLPRIAVVHPSHPVAVLSAIKGNQFFRGFFAELERLGYSEGKNLTVERYSGDGRTDRYAEFAKEIVSRSPDVIFVISSRMVEHFKSATQMTPIVGVISDPIARHFSRSIGRPGGNITGVVTDAGLEIWEKRLALLKEVAPKADRVGFLAPKGTIEGPEGRAVREASERMNVALTMGPLESPINQLEYVRVFGVFAQESVRALVVSDAAENATYSGTVVELAAKARLPAIGWLRDFTEDGGLMAYAIDLVDLYGRAAGQVAQILNGTKVGEIPFYRATTFKLIINLKTAKALGLNVPPTLLARADEVIE